MKGHPRSLPSSTSTARVLLIALCVGLVTLSMVAPVVHSVPDNGEATPGSVQQHQPPAEAPNDTTNFPPGTSETGIENVTRLTEAHRSALNNSTHEAQMEWDQVSATSSRSSAGFEVVPISTRTTNGANSSLIRLASEGVVNTYWITDDATASETSFDTPQAPPSHQYHNRPLSLQDAERDTLHDWLNTSTYDYTGALTRNNRTLHEYWATGLRGNTSPIENAHARVLVDQEGVIHEAIVTRVYSRENETVTARLNYTLQRSSTSPPTQPEWVTAELPHLDASVIGNGTVIALEHTGGRTVPHATIQTFFPDGPQTDTEITDFERGETLYLYRTDADPDRVTVSENEAPAINESFVPVGEDSVLVSVFDRPAPLSGPNETLLIEVEPRDR